MKRNPKKFVNGDVVMLISDILPCKKGDIFIVKSNKEWIWEYSLYNNTGVNLLADDSELFHLGNMEPEHKFIETLIKVYLEYTMSAFDLHAITKQISWKKRLCKKCRGGIPPYSASYTITASSKTGSPWPEKFNYCEGCFKTYYRKRVIRALEAEINYFSRFSKKWVSDHPHIDVKVNRLKDAVKQIQEIGV